MLYFANIIKLTFNHSTNAKPSIARTRRRQHPHLSCTISSLLPQIPPSPRHQHDSHSLTLSTSLANTHSTHPLTTRHQHPLYPFPRNSPPTPPPTPLRTFTDTYLPNTRICPEEPEIGVKQMNRYVRGLTLRWYKTLLTQDTSPIHSLPRILTGAYLAMRLCR